MTYKIEGKYYELNNEDMKEVRKNMKEFNLDEDTAARMFFEDWEYIEPVSKVKSERVREIKEKKVYAKSEKARKNTQKERKVDTEKGELLALCKTILEQNGANVESVKTETEISFTFGENNYTLKLTKHRAKKTEV